MIIDQGNLELAERRIHEQYTNEVHSGRWLDYPKIVTIETFCKCNGRCTFCPYTHIDRIGSKLSDACVCKMIDEVSKFPVFPERLNLCRVNEPFLDKRIFSFLAYANERLPETNLILFSNGSTITDKVIENLNKINNFKLLIISFNENDPRLYHNVMGLDYNATLKNIKNLHDRKINGELKFNVNISRVGTSNSMDSQFLAEMKKVFPHFASASSAKFSWVGVPNQNSGELTPNAGCAQWFSLHILANGKTAFCCIDGYGQEQQWSIYEKSLYDIYNLPVKRRLRENVISRKLIPTCRFCIHGMPSNAYRKKG